MRPAPTSNATTTAGRTGLNGAAPAGTVASFVFVRGPPSLVRRKEDGLGRGGGFVRLVRGPLTVVRHDRGGSSGAVASFVSSTLEAVVRRQW